MDPMAKWLGMPIQASAHAPEIDRMTILTHWLMLALFVGWIVYFLYVLFRFSARRNPRANYAGVRSHYSQYVEIGVAVVEAVLLVAFAIPAWANRVAEFPPEESATVVRVVAEQFAWNVHYPGADGKFGRTDLKLIDPANPLGLDRSDGAAKDDITTINQIHLPIDKPVIVHLSSKDVIHSFGVYELRVKQDAVPGMETPLWFEPNRAGEYDITCSQLCGLGHYRMRGFVTVEDTAAFNKFLAEAAAEQ